MPFINNWNYVIAAYALTWVVLGGYWIYVHRTVRQAREELATAVREGESQ